MVGKPVNVVAINKPSLLDTPATLRGIADKIEAEEYGIVSGAAVVLDSEDNQTFGAGMCDPSRAHILFAKGMRKIENL